MPDYHTYLDLRSIDSSLVVTRTNLIVNYFKKTPILEALFFLSNLDRYLFRADQDSFNTQADLISRIFDCDPKHIDYEIITRIKSEFIRKLRQSSDSEQFAFHCQQIYYAIALTLKYSKFSDGLFSSANFSVGLLKVNSLLNKEAFEKSYQAQLKYLWTPRNTTLKKDLISTLWESSQFNFMLNRDIGTEFARGHAVFFNTTSGIVFQNEFLQNIGVGLKDFWFVCYAIYASWVSHSREIGLYEFALNIDSYLEIFDIPRETFEKVLSIISGDPAELNESFQKMLSARPEVKPEWNFLALEDKPLLRNGEKYICLSLPYFVKRVYSDVVSLFQEYCSKVNGASKSGTFGNAYEEYVKWLFEKALQSSSEIPSHRLHFATSNNIQISDAVIDYGYSLVFVEVKAKIRRQLSLGSDPIHIENRLKELLLKKSKCQLEHRIEEFRDGRTSIPGISPDRVSSFWPVLVICRGDIPHFDLLYDLFDEILKKNNLLQAPYLMPLSIIDIRELEIILEMVESGHSFIDILRERHLPINRKYAFGDLLAKKYQRRKPAHLSAIIKDVNVEFTDKLKSNKNH